MIRATLRDDGGFTLVELLIAIAILAIIMVPLATGVMSILHNSTGTVETLNESHDAQITAAYFPIDAESADVSGTAVSGSNNDSRCDKSGTTPVVRFAWTEYSTAGGVAAYKVVVYSTESSGSAFLLRRQVCQGTTYGGLSSTPVSNLIVSHNLQSTSSWSITNSSCTEGFKTLSMTVTETSTYSFKVSGTRRTASC